MSTHRKLLFGRAVIAFFVFQTAVDLAHSVTLFPFVHYGMFSESFRRPDSLKVFEVTVDGRRLESSSFRVYRWDMIQTPLTAFEQYRLSSDFAIDRRELGMYMQKTGATGLYRWIEPRLKNDTGMLNRFPRWYKSYLSRLLGQPVGTVMVDRSWYRYQDGRLQLISKENYFTL